MDEKNVVEEVVEDTVIIDEIWQEVKENWWKGLIGLGTAALTFAGGYFLGSNHGDAGFETEPNPEEPPFVEGDDLI